MPVATSTKPSKRNLNRLFSERRFGIFAIHARLLEVGDEDELCRLFGNFIIVSTIYHPLEEVYEYKAVSPLFDVLHEAEMVPFYEIEAMKTPGTGLNWITFRATKIEVLPNFTHKVPPLSELN